MPVLRPLAVFLLIATAAAAQAPQPYPADGQAPPQYDQQQFGQEEPGQQPPGQHQQGGQPGSKGMKPLQRFQAANTTHDGKLTREQAQAAHLRPIVKNFDAIDRERKGYVTVQDIREWRHAQHAARDQQGQFQGQQNAPQGQPPGPPPQ